MRKKVVFILLILPLLLMSTTITTPKAVNYGNIGISVGNRADYASMGFWPRFGVLVNNVSGTFANLTLTNYYLNGTIARTYYFYGDVSAGDLETVLIPANLRASDPIYSGSNIIINRTSTMNVAGALRSINNFTWYSGGAWNHIYWDQSTGILIEVRAHLSANETMISTNMWQPSLSSTPPSLMTLLLAGGAVALIVSASVVVILRRHGR